MKKQDLSFVITIHLIPTVKTKDQLPLLISAMQTQVEPLRSAAREAISRIAPELLTNTPAK